MKDVVMPDSELGPRSSITHIHSLEICASCLCMNEEFRKNSHWKRGVKGKTNRNRVSSL